MLHGGLLLAEIEISPQRLGERRGTTFLFGGSKIPGTGGEAAKYDAFHLKHCVNHVHMDTEEFRNYFSQTKKGQSHC
jgi:hypothetical protein